MTLKSNDIGEKCTHLLRVWTSVHRLFSKLNFYWFAIVACLTDNYAA